MPATAFDFFASDGTRLRGWCSGVSSGVPVVISNGLGTPPEAWPALVAAESGLCCSSWFWRGLAGSERPRDPARLTIADHADDLVALLDEEGIDRAVVVGWSLGVNAAFEAAVRHPDRVAGVLAVAGVPTGTFASMFAPLRLPTPLRRPIGMGLARGGRLVGPLLNAALPRIPVSGPTLLALRHSGFLLPATDPDLLARVLPLFLQHDWSWYFHLALVAAEQGPVDLGAVGCPVTLVSGRVDVLAAAADMRAVKGELTDARLVRMPGSHFLPLEEPDTMLALTLDLIDRAHL